MQYEKPELVRLGLTRELILGRKFSLLESVRPERPERGLDSELDD